MEINKVYNGFCLEVLKTFSDNFFDSVVTDPPYGISFMNKHWDYDVPKVEVWQEVLRVLKPGGFILCACGTRTQHRMAVNIEDAGFEIRDIVSWWYGSGFPKSLDVSKAIDKGFGIDRIITGTKETGADKPNGKGTMQLSKNTFTDADGRNVFETTASATAEGKQWEGWGTALKPACELWTLARKPLSEDTVAQNVLKWGTGGLDIDGSRIGFSDNEPDNRVGTDKISKGASKSPFETGISDYENPMYKSGRFPANLIIDEFIGQELDKQTGEYDIDGDSGGASRFFYCPKPDNYERNKGLKEFTEVRRSDGRKTEHHVPNLRTTAKQNFHPTVKPIDLMRYLVKLITPKGGIVLDPYIGSGTTGIGAKLELINYVGIA